MPIEFYQHFLGRIKGIQSMYSKHNDRKNCVVFVISLVYYDDSKTDETNSKSNKLKNKKDL